MTEQKKSNPYVIVRQSAIHGTGVFAAQDIKKGQRIIEYVGEQITKQQSEEREETRYLFELNDTRDIDGNVSYNDARFINHSCDPNCETRNEKDHIWVYAIKNIKKGQELSYNYGYDLQDCKDYPCKCGSNRCVGYILDEDLWYLLQKKK